jgi:D-glycero-D-manno-heptose 1,7-bisphosphate phosphatase
MTMKPVAWIVQPNGQPGRRRAAVFLDRDGVLNENRADYVRTWAQVEFLPGVFAAMRRLAGSPFAVVIVTNQSAVGRGLMTVAGLAAINQGIVRQVQQAGGRIDAVYACPHRPDEDCPCRKPRPGMLLQAAWDLGIDLERSYLVGDARSDMEAGLAAGCQPVMVHTGRGRKQAAGLADNGLEAVPVVADLGEAVDLILNQLRLGP